MEKNEDTPIWFYIAISIALHIIVYLLFHFTLPHFKKEPKEQVMTFEVVPVQETSNIKTQKHQKEEAKKEEKAKKRAKSKKTEPKPTPKPEPKKSPPKPKEEKKPAPKPAPKKKQEPVKKKAPPKPKPKPKPKVNHMEQLLKNLEKESQGKEERARKQALEKKNTAIDDAIGRYKENSPMSIGEENYIKQKIEQNWNIPIGAQRAGELVVPLLIKLNVDGSLESLSLGKMHCPPGLELSCQAAIDSAVRAVKQASPFDKLKADRYETWAEFQFNFDPKDALQ